MELCRAYAVIGAANATRAVRMRKPWARKNLHHPDRFIRCQSVEVCHGGVIPPEDLTLTQGSATASLRAMSVDHFHRSPHAEARRIPWRHIGHNQWYRSLAPQ